MCARYEREMCARVGTSSHGLLHGFEATATTPLPQWPNGHNLILLVSDRVVPLGNKVAWFNRPFGAQLRASKFWGGLDPEHYQQDPTKLAPSSLLAVAISGDLVHALDPALVLATDDAPALRS